MSSATSEPTHHDLVGLLEQARRKNERLGVTVVLVYGDGHFLQLLEGERAVIQPLYAEIARDPRHRNVFKVGDKRVEERTFQEWSMAFHAVAAEQLRELTGYLPPDWLDEVLFGVTSMDTILLERMRELLISKDVC